MDAAMTTLKSASPASVRSIFDPLYVGIDEFGHPVHIPMIYRNILIGGEPNAGKSSLVNNVVAHAALSADCRLVLIDGKQVELGQWEAGG
jgi:S-DNA-T family DNA segregation ATPase FtsK/SpoIIIE